MGSKLPQTVRDQLDKCASAATAGVAAYNRPGRHFRTAQYLILITIAWTALFHAIFFRRRRRPWYRKGTSGTGRGIRYQRIDGEPRYWDLSECLKQYYGSSNPPERKNLAFLVGLRNKIEHRHLPELDASLYGECQASLLNLEALLVGEFGQRFALAEQLAIALQFTNVVPSEKRRAARALATNAAKSVTEYVERFRGALPSDVLNSTKYSFNVFLVPKVANRASAADASVQFIHVDEANPQELERLERLNVLIREKRIPIANLDLLKPSHVVAEVAGRIPFRFNMSTHTLAWKSSGVRPASGAARPDRTRPEYCVFDPVHGDYLYTRAWVEKLANDLSSADGFRTATGRDPISR